MRFVCVCVCVCVCFVIPYKIRAYTVQRSDKEGRKKQEWMPNLFYSSKSVQVLLKLIFSKRRLGKCKTVEEVKAITSKK